MKARLIALLLCSSCALTAQTFPASATKPSTKATPAAQLRKTPPSVAVAGPPVFPILRQDLFDRNNPMNLRSDWPAPPAQPGQF